MSAHVFSKSGDKSPHSKFNKCKKYLSRLEFFTQSTFGGSVFKISALFLSLCLSSLSSADNCAIDEALPEANIQLSETSAQSGTKIIAKFYSAEAVEAIPKLKPLSDKNPGFHKILFKLEGFPKNQEIVFEFKRPLLPNPQFQRVLTFTINDDGSYRTDSGETHYYILGSSRGFYPGERIISRFRAADGSVEQEISGIPQPAIFRDSDNKIAMRAELLSLSPTVYTIDLPTMQEGEEYQLISKSLTETTKSKPKFSSQAPLHYSPAPKTKAKGGIGTLTIKRTSGETYTLALPWGTALEIYQQGAKNYPYHN